MLDPKFWDVRLLSWLRARLNEEPHIDISYMDRPLDPGVIDAAKNRGPHE